VADFVNERIEVSLLKGIDNSAAIIIESNGTFRQVSWGRGKDRSAGRRRWRSDRRDRGSNRRGTRGRCRGWCGRVQNTRRCRRCHGSCGRSCGGLCPGVGGSSRPAWASGDLGSRSSLVKVKQLFFDVARRANANGRAATVFSGFGVDWANAGFIIEIVNGLGFFCCILSNGLSRLLSLVLVSKTLVNVLGFALAILEDAESGFKSGDVTFGSAFGYTVFGANSISKGKLSPLKIVLGINNVLLSRADTGIGLLKVRVFEHLGLTGFVGSANLSVSSFLGGHAISGGFAEFSLGVFNCGFGSGILGIGTLSDESIFVSKFSGVFCFDCFREGRLNFINVGGRGNDGSRNRSSRLDRRSLSRLSSFTLTVRNRLLKLANLISVNNALLRVLSDNALKPD